MPTMLESLEDYFKNTPKEKILSDWKKTEKYNDVGPLAKHYIDEIKKLNTMWIKKQIVIVPSKNGNSKIGLNPKAIFNKPHLYYFNEGAVYYECQHLYIISDEEIKENELVLLPNKEIHRMTPSDMIGYLDSQSKATRKIIATTDSSLNLPQIPQQLIQHYIEEYNKDNVITEVEVEYEDYGTIDSTCGLISHTDTSGEIFYMGAKLKVTPNNTINVKPTKDSWSKKEVIELLHKYESDMTYFGRDSYYKGCFPKVTDDWANENL